MHAYGFRRTFVYIAKPITTMNANPRITHVYTYVCIIHHHVRGENVLKQNRSLRASQMYRKKRVMIHYTYVPPEAGRLNNGLF